MATHTPPRPPARATLSASPASPLARRPLTCLLVWFATVGQAIAFTPVLLRHAGWADLSAEPFVVASTWVGLLLPSLVVTRACGGREAVLELVGSAIRLRQPVRWWALTVIVVPALVAAVHVVAEGSPETVGHHDLTTGYLLPLVVVLVTVNLAEEIAWTGVFQRTLQRRGRRALTAALLVTPLFAFQHVSLASGTAPQIAGFMVLLTALSFPFRCLQGWVVNRTGSVLLTGVLHAAGNAAALGSIGFTGLVPRLWGEPGQSALVFAALGLLALVVTRGRLGLEPR